jgi:hypothetical protein
MGRTTDDVIIRLAPVPVNDIEPESDDISWQPAATTAEPGPVSVQT